MTKEMFMYQLRETMCLIYSARQVQRYYFKQMSSTATAKWWKSWNKYQEKLSKIRDNMPESATIITRIQIPRLSLLEKAAHEAVNLKSYKLSAQVIEWYREDQRLRAQQDKFMENCPANILYYSRIHSNELRSSLGKLDKIFENGLNEIVGDPDDNCNKGDRNEH